MTEFKVALAYSSRMRHASTAPLGLVFSCSKFYVMNTTNGHQNTFRVYSSDERLIASSSNYPKAIGLGLLLTYEKGGEQ